jgi:glycosyltransferase involved in cell wall biosynthesis
MYEHFAKIIGISQGFKPERLYVVYNSLDYNKQVEARQTVTPEKTEALREKLFPGSNDPIIMLAGRVIERRRYDLAFEAGSILQKQGYPVNFLILGNGPELENYRDLAKRLGVNANFYGACYDENEIALMFSTCDCGLCPGPLGLAVTHGYAYGRPMIASDYAGEQGPEWGSIVPGVNGDLFKYNDPESLASKIRDWTWPNADIPQKVADACREVVEKRYNPRAQRLVIEAALRGEPANDLMLSWQDETPASQDARHALPSPANDN